jgi:phospholipase C
MATSLSPREAGSLPFPDRPVGEPDTQMPFDHVVVVMMENHSFDNLLGALPLAHAGVDGLTFDSAGNPTNANPTTSGTNIRSFALQSTEQKTFITQSWKAAHGQINGGAMDGFVRTAGDKNEPMGYYSAEVLPFAYSLASTFTVANRWFCSVPAPTYPNRRFLLAATAFGATVTNPLGAFAASPPPHGTIFDQLSDRHVSWGSYFTDVPMTAVIPSIIFKHLDHHHLISKFFHECEAGSLPAVSFVDPALGKLRSIVASLPSLVQEALKLLGVKVDELPQGGTEEDPQDMYYGEVWAHEVVEAVLRSPAWSRTLLIYMYDEHGGYYDHVPPPPAPIPDDIPPEVQEGEPAGDYDTYGPRVPAVVVSPYSRPGGSSSVVCDHTSVLATIERKWNLPALTDRDASAATIMDFLDLSSAALLQPPSLQAPAKTGPSGPVTAGS